MRHAPEKTVFPLAVFENLLDDDFEKQWLVEDVFGVGELSACYGAPGDGKSVVMSDAACHVAAGKPWFGKRVQKSGVLYVAAERGTLVKRRMAAWGKHFGVRKLPLAVMGGVDLVSSQDDAERVSQTVARIDEDSTLERGIEWIIIDTKARVMGGGDENAAKDMNALVANCALIQSKTLCHVTLIDHVPHHDRTRMRGHGALLGAADATFRVSKANGLRTFEVDKVNDGPDDIRFSFKLESVVLGVNEETGKETTAPVVVPSDASSPPVPTRKLSDRHKLALEALTEALLLKGMPAPPSYGLPGSLRTVEVAVWREELARRGVIDSESKNPRADFIRIRDTLASRHLIGVRDALVWSAA